MNTINARRLAALLTVAGVALAAPAYAEPYISLKGYSGEPPTGWIVTPDRGAYDVVFPNRHPAKILPATSIAVRNTTGY